MEKHDNGLRDDLSEEKKKQLIVDNDKFTFRFCYAVSLTCYLIY